MSPMVILPSCLEKDVRSWCKEGEPRWDLVDSLNWGNVPGDGDQQTIQNSQGRAPERRKLLVKRAPEICRESPLCLQLSTNKHLHVRTLTRVWEKPVGKEKKELMQGWESYPPLLKTCCLPDRSALDAQPCWSSPISSHWILWWSSFQHPNWFSDFSNFALYRLFPLHGSFCPFSLFTQSLLCLVNMIAF